CGRESTCRGGRTGWSSSTVCPSPAPMTRSCRRGHGMPISAESTDSWPCRPHMRPCAWPRVPDASSARQATGESWRCSTRGCGRPDTPASSSIRCRGCGRRRIRNSSARAWAGWPQPTRNEQGPGALPGRSEPADDGDDEAQDLGVGAVDGLVVLILRQQPLMTGLALEGLDRGLTVEQGRDDLPVVSGVLLAHDDPVVVADGGLDHRIADDLEQEHLTRADDLSRQGEDIVDLLLGQD